MKKTWVAALCAAIAVGAVSAQALKRVERADELPRFSYPVSGELEPLLRDKARFDELANKLYKDVEGVLATHDIAELATRRSLIGVLQQIDMLQGRFDLAARRSEQIRGLQEKPADKLLSGLITRGILAGLKAGEPGSPAYLAEVSRAIRAELQPMPFQVIRNDVIRFKAIFETIGEGAAVGGVREVLQPVATRTGALSSDLAPGLVNSRYTLVYALPLKQTLTDTFTAYINANKVDKPDIWAARDVALAEGRPYRPVTVVVWDSGIDAPLFKDRIAVDGGRMAMIAFDHYARPSQAPLKPIPADLQARLPSMQGRAKGLSDLVSNVDSPEASEVKKLLSSLPPQQYKPVAEEIQLTGVYQHGTHVSGIAMAGNPYARLANARIDFGHTLIPDPCPSKELAERSAANLKAYGEFIRRIGARVVNMSWGGNVRGYEVALEQCGIGKDQAERRTIARGYFEMQRKALTDTIASLPEVLFVTSAGNSANDPTFNESYPSGIVAPNLVSVGAVDKAGDEASFTSYGPTVALHANGYQVESFVPGGNRVAISGTSMSAPQVTNLAAKILAVNPALKPAEVIAVMRETAERSEDGRRILVHPAKALAKVGYVK